MRTPLVSGTVLLILAALLPVARPSRAEQAPGALRVAPSRPATASSRATPDPSLVPEVLHLPPAEVEVPAQLDALRAQVAVPGVPYRNGFARHGTLQEVNLGPGAGPVVGATRSASSSSIRLGSWLGRFVVDDAYAFRIGLRDVRLPKGAKIWVDAGSTHLGPYGRELLDPQGTLWLPPVPGPGGVVEIELPATDAPGENAFGFTVGDVMEMVPTPEESRLDPRVWTDCDVDATCVDTATLSTIDQLREAVARLTFVSGPFTYLCSGGLLNDTDPSGFRPLLLTANHCFDSQTAASSLVAYFDYRTDSCNGTAPDLASVPSVAGATLLASSPDSDFTLVELSANPSGQAWYLGWTTTTPTQGSSMERVSHPQGSTQRYSASSYQGDAGILCGGYPTSRFLYAEVTQGSTAGGSSGAPVTQTVDGEALVVGQLLGACGQSGFDDCDYASYNDVDGAFSATYPAIVQWLDPDPACTDYYEPDGSSGQATTILTGETQIHSLCPVGDEDWVTFTLGDESGVELVTSGSSGDTVISLYDAGLSLVETDDDGGTKTFSRIDRLCGVDSLPAGDYFLKVEEYGGDNEIARYDLDYTRLESCAGTCPNELTLSNTTLTGTESYRAHVSITLGPSLTVDGTAIDLIAGQRIAITSGTAIGSGFAAGTDPAACGL